MKTAWLLLALSLAQPAAAGDVVISTGAERGSYYFIGERLKTEMLVAHNQRVDLRTSLGSVQNLSRLADPESEVNVALTQADALDQYLLEHPDFAGSFFVLGEAGRECVLLFARQSDATASAAAFKEEEGVELAVGDASSGAYVTLQSMGRLEPAFQNARAVFEPPMEALLQLKAGGRYSQLDAVMVVQRPRRLSPPLRLVLNEPEVFRVVPIHEAEVGNASLPDGSALYTFERVKLGGASGGGTEVDTMCTRGLLLGSRGKLSKELREQLSRAMLEKGAQIVGPDE